MREDVSLAKFIAWINEQAMSLLNWLITELWRHFEAVGTFLVSRERRKREMYLFEALLHCMKMSDFHFL